jgi:hypothetical protein
MPISQSDLREIIEESLPPHIIDWLKQREEEITRQGEQDRRLPLYITPPPPPEEEEEEKPKRDERGVEIIDYTLESKKIRMKLSELKRIIAEAGRGIMHIIKRNGGKRLPKSSRYDPSRYEFPDNRTAGNVVWEINAETGREAANSGNVVTVYT